MEAAGDIYKYTISVLEFLFTMLFTMYQDQKSDIGIGVQNCLMIALIHGSYMEESYEV